MAPEDSAKSRWYHDLRRPRASMPDPEVTAARQRARENRRRTIAAAIPVAGVNLVAFIGQFSYIHERVHLLPPGAGPVLLLASQILVAVVFETIAVYLAYAAHKRTMDNDSATSTRLAAYLFALVMGAMNYSHYAAPHWHPTVTAVGMALMSASSPWLWGVHTKSASRKVLHALKLIEGHALRLGMTRWLWHPLRSFRVMRWATWHGVTEPQVAIAHFADRYGTADTPERHAAKRASEPAALLVAQPPARRALPEVAAPAAVASGPESAPVPVPAPAGTLTLATMPGEPEPEGEPRLRRVPPFSGPEADAPAVHSASVALQADAKWNERKRPPQEVIDNAQLVLMGTPLDKLPSARSVAKDLLKDANQRRLAADLLADRKKAGTSLVDAPEGEQAFGYGHHVQRVRPGMIASPAAFQPGGSGGGAVNG